VPEGEIDIDSIAAGGDGVGRLDGLVAFVPRTAPGDRAQIRYAASRRFARGELTRLVRASADRTAPLCPHYIADRCGGCQLQHLTYDAQRAAKARIIRDAFARIGHREIPVPEVVASPLVWRYRSKLTLAMRRHGDRWIAGLHPYDDPNAVFPLTDCPITDESVLAVWRDILAADRWLPPVASLRGSVRDATLSLEGGPRHWATHAEFFAAVPSLAELWWDGHLLHRRDATSLGVSFSQINTSLASSLRADVIDRAWRYAPTHVVDAYAGRGEVAAALAQRGAQVTAIEVDDAASAHTRSTLPPGSRALTGRVEDLLAESLPADVAILNPPRTGVHDRVTELLAQPEGPAAIIYVSCDPATLARDVSRLTPYRISSVRAFDMFPQTAHVETVCELVR
jgi:23S rRNA (uracil1939-C5)-methyltransferase